MDKQKLEADLNAIFSDCRHVQFSFSFSDFPFTVTVIAAKHVPFSVLTVFVRVLREYGFQTYTMEVRNKITNEVTRYFSPLTIDEAIRYRPRFWEKTVWIASYYPQN